VDSFAVLEEFIQIKERFAKSIIITRILVAMIFGFFLRTAGRNSFFIVFTPFPYTRKPPTYLQAAAS